MHYYIGKKAMENEEIITLPFAFGRQINNPDSYHDFLKSPPIAASSPIVQKRKSFDNQTFNSNIKSCCEDKDNSLLLENNQEKIKKDEKMNRLKNQQCKQCVELKEVVDSSIFSIAEQESKFNENSQSSNNSDLLIVMEIIKID